MLCILLSCYRGKALELKFRTQIYKNYTPKHNYCQAADCFMLFKEKWYTAKTIVKYLLYIDRLIFAQYHHK